jgi:hypothetical protein
MENEDQREEPVPWEEFKAEAIKSRDQWFAINPLKYESLEDHVQWGLNYTFSNNPQIPAVKVTQEVQKRKTLWNRLFSG